MCHNLSNAAGKQRQLLDGVVHTANMFTFEQARLAATLSLLASSCSVRHSFAVSLFFSPCILEWRGMKHLLQNAPVVSCRHLLERGGANGQ